MGRWNYFTNEEAKGIEDEVMAKLDMARKYAGIPLVITCGLRLPGHNAEVGGLADSAHLPDANGLSQAVDIACCNSSDRWKMVIAFWQAGFKRIVIELEHLHIDIDPTKPQEVLAILDKP